MQAKSSKPAFAPFDLTITFESKEEAQALFSLFNVSPIVKALGIDDFDCAMVRDQIRAAIPTINRTAPDPAYERFVSILKPGVV